MNEMKKMAATAETLPFRAIDLGPYGGTVERREDGSLLINTSEPLRPSKFSRYTEALAHWAKVRPDATFLAKRDEHGNWQHLTYAEAMAKVVPLSQALLDRGVSVDRPLMILSENDLEHALLGLAAAHIGAAYVPVSPAYSLRSKEAERVKHAVELTTPGLVFASDAERFARAIEQAVPADVELVFTRGTLPGRRCSSIEQLLATRPTEAVAQAHARITPDTVLKFLFTSGSTKLPKAVVNTHRMMLVNPQMYTQAYPFVEKEPPVLVDWLPWHHTAGGNNNVNLILYQGGTIYIDDGKPTPEGIAETLRNLREISPTIYYTVPKGLEALVHEMQSDQALRESFFRRLRLVFPAGAALSKPLKDAFDRLAVNTCGARIPMTMGLGMTETAPFAISAHLPDWQAGHIGLPASGVTVKLVPCGDKMEVRYRGPTVTPGYWRQPDLTREAFDEEGFFCSGDAARFIDEATPERGLRFDGRIAEDFKLISGTWVNVGALRNEVIAAGAPYIHDVVLTGHDRDTLGMLVFLLPTVGKLATTDGPGEDWAAIAADPAVRNWAQELLDRLARAATGSSHRIVRAMLMAQPPMMEFGELTDKGSINQRAVLKRRADLVELLYAPGGDPRVLLAQGFA